MNTHKHRNISTIIVLLVTSFILSFVTGQSVASSGRIIYVDMRATGNNDGTSWENAFNSLQSALLEAIAGDQIWVAQGIYKPGGPGEHESSFQLKNRVELFGGFTGTETALEQRDWNINVTVLSGDIDNDDITDPNGIVTDPSNIVGQNSIHVLRFYYNNSTSWTTVLDGFTITAGTANGYGIDCVGGGVINDGNLVLANDTFSANTSSFQAGGIRNEGRLFISNSVITHNSTYDSGGGIYSYGTLVVSGSEISNNHAGESGGGITSSGQLTVTNTVISGNNANYGAGIMDRVYNYLLPYADLTVQNSLFIQNTAYGSGGGIYNGDGTVNITNSTFSDNLAFVHGGGIYNASGSTSLNSNTLSSNSAYQAGGGIYNDIGTVNLTNTLITASLSGGNCSGSMIDAGWNLSYPDVTCPGMNTDPLLGPLQENGGSTMTFALLPGSPAIDTGGGEQPPQIDQRGLPRPFDGNSDGIAQSDIGSFEYIPEDVIQYSPTISGIPDLILEENTSNFAISLSIADADTPVSSLNLSIASSNSDLLPPECLILGGSGTNRILYLSPVENQTGSTTITITLSDGELTSNTSFLVTVDPDNAPVLDPIGDQSVIVNQLMTFNATAWDIDGDSLTFSLDPGAPADASIDPYTGTFSWTPTIDGIYSVTIRVSDGKVEAYETITLNVVPLTPPENDSFADAEVITNIPFSDSAFSTYATIEPGEPAGCTWFFDKTIWYAFTPDSSGSYTFESGSQVSDSVLAVYTGTELEGLQTVTCTWGWPMARAVLRLDAGTTYYVQAYNSDNGGVININFLLYPTPPPEARIGFSPTDPYKKETVQFYNDSIDSYGIGFQDCEWNFGDGSTASDCYPVHAFAADGDYIVELKVTTYDGRIASTSQSVQVRTHDVGITKFIVPTSARAGQTKQISVSIKNLYYPEAVQVDLYKVTQNGYELIGTVIQDVPIRPPNRAQVFTFNYTFTSEDAAIGKVTFKAVVTIINARDAFPADNEVTSIPTKVSR